MPPKGLKTIYSSSKSSTKFSCSKFSIEVCHLFEVNSTMAKSDVLFKKRFTFRNTILSICSSFALIFPHSKTDKNKCIQPSLYEILIHILLPLKMHFFFTSICILNNKVKENLSLCFKMYNFSLI